MQRHNIRVREANTQEEILNHYDLIKEIPTLDVTTETMLARCLIGQYSVLFGDIDEKTKGIVLFEIKNYSVWVVGVSARGCLDLFLTKFYEKLDSMGIVFISAQSALPEDKFIKATKLNKLWTVYGRRISDVLDKK